MAIRLNVSSEGEELSESFTRAWEVRLVFRLPRPHVNQPKARVLKVLFMDRQALLPPPHPCLSPASRVLRAIGQPARARSAGLAGLAFGT